MRIEPLESGIVLTMESKLGKAKGVERSRIWIEGNRLAVAGFAVGARYNVRKVQTESGMMWHLLLTFGEDGKRKVSGKGNHPIIDIVGKAVYDTFGARGESVRIRYGDGVIEIASV